MFSSQVEWLRLRIFSGSQDAAFEEVCKQLFGAECRAAGGRWVPTGRIDAGVEGYCIMPDDGEWGVQAKWFLTSPNPQQWKDVDESVATALNRHPRLTRYVVCMPVDLSDARTPGTTSARERWEVRRAQYEGWAAYRGMTVTFEFRGSHELAQQLIAPENSGLRSYWFGGPEFSPETVKRRIEDILSAVGPRYSKELNVDVPLSRFVDAMTLSRGFVERVFVHYRAVRKATASLQSHVVRARWAQQADEIAGACSLIVTQLEPLAGDRDAAVDWNAISEIAGEAAAACRGLSRVVREAGEVADDSERVSTARDRNPYEHHFYDLSKLASALANLHEYAEGGEAHLSRTPFLLLVGEAGSGKTHFLCDVAVRSVDANNIAILALGSPDFDAAGLWHEIGRRNGLPSDHAELLGALQSAAEAAETRALVLVDAINEGPSAGYWQRQLSVIINQVKRYPRVGLLVSVRDTFLTECIREDAKAQLFEVVHEGFAYNIIEAQRAFFRNFRIREPAVPLLLPEFANPLFLMLFCKGIVAAGLSDVPRGLSGLTAIFEFFVDALNRKISSDLDVDPGDRLVHRALDALAAALTPQRPNTLDRAEAKAIVETVHTAPQYSRSLFGALEREGLISTIRYGDASYVRFTYERMADHARARRLLEQVPDTDAADPELLGARIAEALTAEDNAFRSTGLFEALSLQVPERYGPELMALLPGPYRHWQLQALLRTLPWRRPDSVGKAVTTGVFRSLETEPDLREDVVDSLLGCALVPGSPLNAAGLHAYLRGLDMSRRDALWTVTISRRQYDGSAVMRMTSWAREGAFGLRGDAADDAAQSAALTLLWLCASTNRRVRDEATKGVVAILDAAPSIAIALYERFCDCNDPYVVQRLYAALAGFAMRTATATVDLTDLAQAVLRRSQDIGLPVDILARDFARSIVERAQFLGAIGPHVDVDAVRPPYGEAPPDLSDADDALYASHSWTERRENSNSDETPRGLLHVHSSLGPHGDFARYIVGTNFRGDWLRTPLTDAAPPTREGRRAAFAASLTRAQTRLHKRFITARSTASTGMLTRLRRALAPQGPAEDLEVQDVAAATDGPRNKSHIEDLYQSITMALDESSKTMEEHDGSVGGETHGEPTENDVAVAKRRFVVSLDADQARAFEALETEPNDFDRYDLALGTRWMFRRVLEMGYGGAEVYAFDERAAREAWNSGEGRQPATIERIGKKYQWIVFFEFSARMADNYYLDGWHSESVPFRYQVPAQVLARDIDPSSLTVNTRRASFEPHQQSWWSGPTYADWQEHAVISDWIRDDHNLPDPANGLAVTDPAGVQWICLNTHLSWREREVLVQDRYDVQCRELWYLLFGYLVPKSEAQRAHRWLRRQDFSGRWLRPEAADTNRLLWGELFWSPSFALDADSFTVPRDALHDITQTTKRLLIPATCSYVYERGNDNSIIDTLRIGFPIVDIVHGIGGIASDPERGAWLDATSRIVCFDPSVAHEGPGAVLVRRDLLEMFLRNSSFALVWTLLSEKQVVGGNAFHTNHGRLVTSGAYWLREAADGTFTIEGGKTSRFQS